MTPQVKGFFDPTTFTISYVVWDQTTRVCAIIDPVLDYDPATGQTNTTSAMDLVKFIKARDLKLTWILETHVHADHLSAATFLKEKLGGKIGISARIIEVMAEFGGPLTNGEDLSRNDSPFDHMFADNEPLSLGDLKGRVLQTPGHTPACATFVFGSTAFTGDTLFMPDCGTARCDFPGGDAKTLYQSIQKILALPESTQLYVGHDYGPGGRDYAWQTTVKAQKQNNIHIKDDITKAAFIETRTKRDQTLSLPNLFNPAVQFNIRAGDL